MGINPPSGYRVYKTLFRYIAGNTRKHSVKPYKHGYSEEEVDVRVRKTVRAMFGEMYEYREITGPKPKSDDELVERVYERYYREENAWNMSQCVRFCAPEQIKKLNNKIQEKSFIRRISRKVKAARKIYEEENTPERKAMRKELDTWNPIIIDHSFKDDEIIEQVNLILRCLKENGWLSRRYIKNIKSDIFNDF